MTYQHPHQLPTTVFPLSNPNTHTLPPALLQALHRLATFSSDIQLLTSHFAPHLAHHPCFSQPTPQHFPRRRKPTTRSTAWRLQHLLPPDPITQLPAMNASLLPLIATPITNAPPRPVSAPPSDLTQHASKIPRSSSTPPCHTTSRLKTTPCSLPRALWPLGTPSPAKIDSESTQVPTTAVIDPAQVKSLIIHQHRLSPECKQSKEQQDLVAQIEASPMDETITHHAISTTDAYAMDTSPIGCSTGHKSTSVKPAAVSHQVPIIINGANDSNDSNNPISNAIKLNAPDSKSRIDTTDDLICSAANDPIVHTGFTSVTATGCETFGDFEQQTVANVDQSRPVDSVLNCETHVSDGLESITDIGFIPSVNSINTANRNPVFHTTALTHYDTIDLASSGTCVATSDVDLGPNATIDQGLDCPSSTSTPTLQSINSIYNNKPEIASTPLESAICLGAISVGIDSTLCDLEVPVPSDLSHHDISISSSTKTTLTSINKKKKKKKKKKKTSAIDNNLSEQHCREYDVADNFGFYAPNGWIEDHHHSSNHSPSLQQDTHTPSETNYDHLFGLVHQLLSHHHMYDLLQVDEQGILFGKEYGQHIQNQDVICYSHEGEFMFRRTKDGKIFDYLDVLEY
ncbi:hypothetical protein DFH28DRAFT_1049364 [Melampsora americana]|nr:hypothetical protein DFH28DRAFT_1049364 [Melampsora americana]